MQFSGKLTNSYRQRLHSTPWKNSSYFGGFPALTDDQTYMKQEVIFVKPFNGRGDLLPVTPRRAEFPVRSGQQKNSRRGGG